MLEVGLTGAIGSGKTTVAAGLVARGAVLIDADLIVRDLQRPGHPVFEAMVQRWGARIVADDGSLDREAVAEIVFADDAELEALNRMVHPAVGSEIVRRREELKATDSIVLFDIPLLIDAEGARKSAYDYLAAIIVVDVDEDIAVARLVEYRGFSAEDARARLASQAPRADRLAHADFVVDNSGPLADLDPQLDVCWSWLRSLHP